MWQNTENVALQNLQILYNNIFVLHAEKAAIFGPILP